ncbi:MAG TPA: TIGR00730 family Rossman fold protein [Acetobacteraceae bacterium]
MSAIHSVAVFCGSRPGLLPDYHAAATSLGRGLARAGLRLVFGGGRIGLMGALADAALAEGGEVLGVIPEFLTRREVAHAGLTELIVTDSMHLRKQRMYELSDAFVVLPGGLGTLDEALEVITWRQLGLHDKPILLCDVAGSAAPLVAAIEAAIARGFATPAMRGLFMVTEGVEATLDAIGAMEPGEGAPAARM